MEGNTPLYELFRNITTDGKEFRDEILAWIETADENKRIYQDLVNIYMITGRLPESFSPDKSKAWSKIQTQIHAKKNKRIQFQQIAKIAASIVIVFSVAWTAINLNRNSITTYSEIISPVGQKSKIILPDSSVVMLNGGSCLRYSNHFAKKTREVILTGEGYFDITKNQSKKFIVQANGLSVDVYGTVFNVKAYTEDELVEVGLKRGKVGIRQNKNVLAKLSPGQTATLDKKENKLNISRQNIDLITAWTKDELAFEEKTLHEIVKYLERWYGVEISISDQLLQDKELLTFKVKTESLRELLKLINLLRPIDYEIDGKEVIITNP